MGMGKGLFVVSKGIGLEMSVDRTEYMVMCRDGNVRRSYGVKGDDSTFERVGGFKIFGYKHNRYKLYSGIS
jgi:hypothetical protein